MLVVTIISCHIGLKLFRSKCHKLLLQLAYKFECMVRESLLTIAACRIDFPVYLMQEQKLKSDNQAVSAVLSCIFKQFFALHLSKYFTTFYSIIIIYACVISVKARATATSVGGRDDLLEEPPDPAVSK